MRGFGVWSNLSECTFVLPPSTAGADYRVRIFSLSRELPFAGHPTLGTARAWLDAGGQPTRPGVVIQECGAGLVPVRLAFAAPQLVRTGPIDPAVVAQACAMVGLTPGEVVAAEWINNGPEWMGLLLGDATTLLSLRPSAVVPGQPWDIGLVAPLPAETEDGAAFELRAFFTGGDELLREDPVTGSLNAGVAQWLLGSGRARAPYLARQGTALGRCGRIAISQADDDIWVSGRTHVAITGTIDI